MARIGVLALQGPSANMPQRCAVWGADVCEVRQLKRC